VSDDDAFELLVARLREVAASIEPERSDDDVIAHVMAQGAHPASPRRRRPRRTAAVVIAMGLVAGTGAAAASVIARREAGRPEAGAVCRNSPKLDASAIVIALGPDPIGDCAVLWSSGELPRVGQQNAQGASPVLIACVGETTAIEVLPATSGETCASFGLSEADVAEVLADPLVALNDRLVHEINMHCMSGEAAADLIRTMMADLAIDDLPIVIHPGDGECVRAGLDSETRAVFVVPSPPPEG
jgi:hypothetical protein